ncbi:uncharacterized protein LOC143296598 [Babylonia areolata]|uniref:uncharacterized protein LOC143296598 n=1 Tax=Babylonia areolata TaxID=304850 RepID=UPI003FD23E21
MDKSQRKIRRSPSVKRRSKVLPVGQRLTLERVLGLTVSSNAAFACDPVSGVFAYPAGCVVVLFNPRRNRQSHIFNVSKKTITSVAFSADGKHLVTGECGHQPAVRVWDVEEKTQVAEFHGHKFGVNCVAFSPNLKFIVSIGSQHDMVVNLWNWRTGNKLASNKVSSKVSSVAFGADSSFFVTVGNRHVKFWYLDGSQSKINQTVPLLGHSGILAEHKNNYFCDVVCGRGKASGSTYVITQSGLLCEFNDKRLLDKWVELRTKSAKCITAGEEHIYIGCAEGVVRVFSTSSLQFVATLPQPHHLGVDVAAATSSSDLICTETDAKYPDVIAITLDDDHKKVACVYNDHSLYVWDIMNVQRVGKAWSFLFHSGCVWALEVYPGLEKGQTGVLPPGSFLTASSDNTIRVWNLDPHVSHTPGYTSNIYSSELLKVVYTDPTHSFLCDVDYNPAGGAGKTDMTWEGKNGVRSIRVSPDGEHLASGDRQGNVRIYDLRQMSEIRCIEAHESDVVCLEYSFSKAGPRILASGSRDRLIHVYDVEQRYGLLQTLDDHSAAIQSVRFTDANNKLRMLSCGSDKSLLFRNASLDMGFEFSLDQHLVSKSTMYDMIIDPRHKFVATACQDRNVRIYNMATAKQKKNYRASLGDEGTLLRLQLDPSGTYVATSCTDKNVCVLDFYTGELAATVYGHSDIVTGLRFTSDLKHLISVSADGCIFVWRVSTEMSKTMRMRMAQLGKMPKDNTFVSDIRGDRTVVLSPLLDTTFTTTTTTTSSSLFPMVKENISPSSVLSSIDPHHPSTLHHPLPHYPATPVGRRRECEAPQPSPAPDCFSLGPLPSWAKAKMDETYEGTDGVLDTTQPKGRWAQRFDHNLAFKSQLDLSQIDEMDTDGWRLTGVDGGLQSGMLASSLPDLRRETVVLSQQHLPAKNIPIIDDDDEISVDDDDEDFFPAYLKDKLPKNENDCSSSEVGGRRRTLNGDSLDGRLDRTGLRRCSNRMSVGSEDLTHSTDFEDMEDSDAWPDASRVVYPPSKPYVVEPCDCTYQVFASDEIREKTRRTSSIQEDEDGDTGPQASGEENDEGSEVHDDMFITRSSVSDPVGLHPPDKEQFVKENFESVSFTPVSMDKFVQQVASLEQAADIMGQKSGLPFSPRLSLSSKFLSRSHFVGVRSGAKLGTRRNIDNPANHVPTSTCQLARSVQDVRNCLAAMNWRTGGLLHESPEKEDPPSPPTKLENKEPSFSTPVSSSHGSLGVSGSPPSPRTLHHFEAHLPLSHHPVREKTPLPTIPLPRTLTSLKKKAGRLSDSPVRDKNCPTVRITAQEGEGNSNSESPIHSCTQKQLSSLRLSRSQIPPLTPPVDDTTFVKTSEIKRSQSPCCLETLQGSASSSPQSPQFIRSPSSKPGPPSVEDPVQAPKINRSYVIARSPQSSRSSSLPSNSTSQDPPSSPLTPVGAPVPQCSETSMSAEVTKPGQSAQLSYTPEPHTSLFSLRSCDNSSVPADPASPALSQTLVKSSDPAAEIHSSVPSSANSCPTSPVRSTSQSLCLEHDRTHREKKGAAENTPNLSGRSESPQMSAIWPGRSASPQCSHMLSERSVTPKVSPSQSETESPQDVSPESSDMLSDESGSHEFPRSKSEKSELSQSSLLQSNKLACSELSDSQLQECRSPHLQHEPHKNLLSNPSQSEKQENPQSVPSQSEKENKTQPLTPQSEKQETPQSFSLLSVKPASHRTLPQVPEKQKNLRPLPLQSEESMCSDSPDIALERNESPHFQHLYPEQWESPQFPVCSTHRYPNQPPSALSPASADGDLVPASCLALSPRHQQWGSELAADGGKLERETSPIFCVPTHDVPSSASHTTANEHNHNNKPAHATASSRNKRSSAEGVRSRPHGAKGPRSSSVPPSPRQAPSYCRTTKSSRLKSASSSNLMKQAETGVVPSAAVPGEKVKVGGKMKKGRLSSSSQARHKSTPNLMACQDVDQTVTATEEGLLPAESCSDLCAAANLSFSEPDICGSIQNSASLDGTVIVSTAALGNQKSLDGHPHPHPHPRGTLPGWRSLPSGNTASQKRVRCVSDTQSMPPPAAPSDAQRRLLRRAAQVHKGSASDLTLEQAKNILLGNSGILEAPHVSLEIALAPSDGTPAPCITGRQTVQSESDTATGIHASYRNSDATSVSSTAVNSPVSSDSTSSPTLISSSPTFSDITTVVNGSPAQDLCPRDDPSSTGSQQTWDSNAKPPADVFSFDIPQHDQPESPGAQPCGGTVDSQHVVFGKPTVRRGDGVSGALPGGQGCGGVSVLDERTAVSYRSPQSRLLEAGCGSVCEGVCRDCQLDSGHRDVSPSPHRDQSFFETRHHHTSLEMAHSQSSRGWTESLCSQSPQGQTVSPCSQSPQGQTVSPCSQSPQGQTVSPCSQSPQGQTVSPCSQSPQGQTVSPCSQSPQGQTVSPCSQSPQGQTVSPQGQTVSPCSQSPQGQTVSPQGQTVSPQGQTVSPCSQSPQGQTESPCSQSSSGHALSSCSESPVHNMSPRSQSDTGLGSDTDTDCDTAHHSPPDQWCSAERRVDRNHHGLSLHLHESFTSSPPPASSSNEELMRTCTSVLDDLKTAVQRTKDFHSKIQQTSSRDHQQMMSRLSDTIHHAHLALAELALHASASSPHPRVCPLVAETTGAATPWDREVMEQARSMLRPLMWGLSQELSREVVKAMHQQLGEGGSSR